jgi:hypothetical protein
MASTRNKNTYGNFELENNENLALFQTNISNSRIYSNNCIAGEGLLGGKFPLNIIANQQVDIETALLGIGSTNLITRKPVTVNLEDIHRLKSLDVCNKLPVIMPVPLAVKKGERPL